MEPENTGPAAWRAGAPPMGYIPSPQMEVGHIALDFSSGAAFYSIRPFVQLCPSFEEIKGRVSGRSVDLMRPGGER